MAKTMRFIWADRLKIILLIPMLLLLSCDKPDYKEIKNVFQPAYDGKSVKSYGHYYKNGLCSNSLIINSDSTFLWEGGCEGNSRSAIGKWNIHKDSIEFIAFKKSPSNLSFNVTFSKSNRNNDVTFIIIDKAHHPIRNFTIQTFNKSPDFFYGDYGLTATKTGLKYYEYNKFKTDSAGVLTLKKDLSDSLDFTKLYPLTGKSFRIRNKDLPDTIRLIININNLPFNYDQLSYDKEMYTRKMKLKYVKGKAIF